MFRVALVTPYGINLRIASKRCPAPIDWQRDALDVGRLIGRQEHGRPCHLARFASSGKHCFCNLPLEHFAADWRRDARANWSRADRVRANAMRPEIKRRAAG